MRIPTLSTHATYRYFTYNMLDAAFFRDRNMPLHWLHLLYEKAAKRPKSVKNVYTEENLKFSGIFVYWVST